MVDFRYSSLFNASIPIKVPASAVSDSTQITISVSRDILERANQNLENLINLPFGCGEQNMIILVPAIVVVDYMTVTNQITEQRQSK